MAFTAEFSESLHVLDATPMWDVWLANTLFQYVTSFHPLQVGFCRIKVFNFDDVPFIRFSLFESCF